MPMSFVPSEPWGSAVIGQAAAFYVVDAAMSAKLVDELARIMGSPGATRDKQSPDATQAMQSAGLPAPHGAELRAWEWMCG